MAIPPTGPSAVTASSAPTDPPIAETPPILATAPMTRTLGTAKVTVPSAPALAVRHGSLDERESAVLAQVAAAFELSDEEVEATLSSVEDALSDATRKDSP